MTGGFALLFPGQGSQIVGMGLDFFENFAVSRDVFLETDDVLSRKLSNLIFNGSPSELKKTTNSQVALMTVSVAILRALQAECGLNVASSTCVAGHSLGEYSALTAAGAINFRNAVEILDARANAMEAAAGDGVGGMAAVIGLDIQTIEQCCTGSISVANDNCPGQIVVSGLLSDFPIFEEAVKARGCRRMIMLDVSGPFHSRYMAGAADVLSNRLASTKITKPIVDIVSNVTARRENDPDVIRGLLVDQLTSRVRFRECVGVINDSGTTVTIEIGSGKVLSGLVSRSAPNLRAISVSSIKDIDILQESGIL